MSTNTVTPPSINDNNHGPYVVFTGAILLSATTLMLIIASYNRLNASTLHKADSPLLAVGAILNVLFFALFAVAVHHGFGRHTSSLAPTELQYLRKLYLGNLILFFVAQGFVKIAYNLLARRTARDVRFQRVMDGFSVIIGIWTLIAVIVMSLATAKNEAPERYFFYTNGAISIAVALGQLAAFLWIVWRTKAKLPAKMRWTFSVGAFVPLCVIVIACRMAYQPEHLLGEDWTFDSVLITMLFILEVNFIFLTVLAPNLPFFFEKTSTGALLFQPGDHGSSRGGGTISGTGMNSYALSSGMRRTRADTERYGDKGDMMVSTVQSHSAGDKNRKSFDSDVILVRRSVEIERESTEGRHSGHTSDPFASH